MAERGKLSAGRGRQAEQVGKPLTTATASDLEAFAAYTFTRKA